MISPQEKVLEKVCCKNSATVLNEELITLSTLGDTYEAITELCAAHQYDQFLIATAPGFEDRFKIDNLILTNLPAYLMDELVRMEQSDEWSILRGIENTLAPFCWSKKQGLLLAVEYEKLHAKRSSHPGEMPAADRLFAKQLGTATIHCVQAPTRNHKRAFIAAFSPSTSKKKIASEFVLAFLEIFDRIERLSGNRTSSGRADLTDRELECLRWASVGKTSAEIAVITSLSEHTVNHYLNFCCKKLDCLNRTQAVAKVLRSGIIP